VLNDYVLGEFFNRCVKLEYEIEANELRNEKKIVPHFKAYRRSPEFALTLESIRDTCLNMLECCEFTSVAGQHYKIDSIVEDCYASCIDFSDLVIIEFCKKENLVVMTDDADYSGCGLEIITANKKIQ
jgi:hypothetical protein